MNATSLILPSFPNNALIPLAIYTKTVNVDGNKFDQIFTGVKQFDDLRNYLIIFGIILSIILIIISILLYIKLGNKENNFQGDFVPEDKSETLNKN